MPAAAAEDAAPQQPGAATTVKVGELYWKQEGHANWLLGVVTAMDAAAHTARFQLLDEATGETLNAAEFPPTTLQLDDTPLFPANPLHSTAADMTSLHHLHEAALAKNLEDRASLKNQRPYTFMANVLIAVNPLRYLEDPDKNMFVVQSLDRCPPHPYYVAENAYRQLSTVRAVMQNQSIIISGESGSGKTETSKIILDFLTTRAQGADRLSSVYSEDDDMEPELTPTVVPPPPSTTAALSYPLSSNARTAKLSPVALGERLMETIPILESFGNAKTHRNHNSSRFGKYMRLQFSTQTQHLSGASIDTYLLEKSRLVNQPLGERNFHVFYELLHSKDTDYLHKLHLLPEQPEEYAFLNQSGCMSSELIDDSSNFQKLCRALEFINVDKTAQDEVFRVVAGLLHLGNIFISEEDTSEGPTACIAKDDTKSLAAMEHAASLLGVEQEELNECIMMKRIMTRGSRRNSIYFAKRDTKNAVYSRDTIAKTIYEHAFNWLMVQCASALDYDSARSDVIPYIGVLDIFGFEDFEPKNRNSLEQLLINYANEALQSLFNACIFEAEQELYRSENIYNPVNHSVIFPFRIPGVERVIPAADDINILAQTTAPSGEMVQYSDNRECLNLIASRQGGLFVTIDNVARMPGPSDRKLNERLHTLFKRHPCFPAPHPKDLRDTFIVRHYAGSVTYTISSFIDKNNNIVSDQFEELIKHSTSRILKDMMARADSNGANTGSKGKSIGAFGPSKRAKGGGSVSSLFSTQMKGLITELEGTACNFVRCIKPNTQMKVGLFDKSFVVEQLRCSGTVQACEVLRVGLPTRILYAEVIDVYKNVLQPEVFMKFDYDDKLFTQALLWAYEFPTSAYRLGNTRLFFRTGKIDLLDKLLAPKVDGEKLTADVLLYLRKKRWVSIATKIIVCNQFVRIFEKCKYRRKAIIIQCMVRQRLARNRVRRVRTMHRISALWNRITDRARVVKSYEDLPEDKMVLLNKLLAKNYLPPGQRWLLKWLGPLARVIYMQKLWKKMTSQYLAKRAFIALFEKVRRRRSAVRMQALARVLLAKKLFRRLKQKRLAKLHWKRGILKARVFCLFRRELHNIHINRLESVNNGLTAALNETQEKLRLAEEETARLREENARLQAALDKRGVQVTEQNKRVGVLETVLQTTQKELVDTQKRAQSGFLERVIRFFTCSMAPSQPIAPQSMLKKQEELVLEMDDKQFVDSEMIPLCKQAQKLKAIGVTKRLLSNAEPVELDPVEDDYEYEEEEMRARESDVLFSVSRFCF